MIRDEAADDCAAGGGHSEGHCITCSDEGVPMRILSTDGAQTMCLDTDDEVHPVAMDLVGPVQIGDRVLVHAGVAIRHLGIGNATDQNGSAGR
jgi:hydrogenase maturation factor